MADNIFRGGRRKGFTTVYRSVAQDGRLSLKARGLFLLLQSLPEDWRYTISGLASMAGTGRDQIRSGLDELLTVGYLVKEQSHDKGGKFAANVYVLQEEAPPLSGFPTTEKPLPENQTLQNNNIHIPPISPQKGGNVKKRKRNKSVPEWKPERFEKFWEYYRTHGRDNDRAGAVREWDRLKPEDDLIDTMARALAAQAASDEWRRGIGIPYACRWLRNERWRDTGLRRPESDTEEAPPRRRYIGKRVIDGEEVDVFE